MNDATPATTPSAMRALTVQHADAATADLLLNVPAQPRAGLLWLPALGVPARHYESLATSLAAQGIAVARHEWRGLGSSNRRASRRHDWNYRELLADVAASLDAAQAAMPTLRWYIGGHSLGSQFATMSFALRPDALDGLIVVAGGSPHWRNFPTPQRWLIRALYTLAPLIARGNGHFPGRRLGFGGNEARSVIRDWAATGRSGRYAPRAVDVDIEAAFASRAGPVLGVWLDQDWFTPRASFDALLAKLPKASVVEKILSGTDFDGIRADHFAWMKQSNAVAAAISTWLPPNPPAA